LILMKQSYGRNNICDLDLITPGLIEHVSWFRQTSGTSSLLFDELECVIHH